MSDQKNITEAEELAEVRKAFLTALHDGLKNNPSPALMAVAQRYIASEADRLPLAPPATASTSASASATPQVSVASSPVTAASPVAVTHPHEPRKLPFPAPAKKPTVQGEQTQGEQSWEKLGSMPFSSDF